MTDPLWYLQMHDELEKRFPGANIEKHVWTIEK